MNGPQTNALRASLPYAALLLTIPAFYLLFNGPGSAYRAAGQALYLAAAVLFGLSQVLVRRAYTPATTKGQRLLDSLLLWGAFASAWATPAPWSAVEWCLRLGYSAAVFGRLLWVAAGYTTPHRLLHACGLSLTALLLAGAGFYWLEPTVQSYADGLWLAFTTGATVGYGDIVPSTPASRIFSVFIVLLGFALLSLVTANIAALLIGEEEKRMRHELHADMRLLLREIGSLRRELEVVISQRDERIPGDGVERT